MNRNYVKPKLICVFFSCLVAMAARYPDSVPAAEEKIFDFDDQYVQIEARKLSGGSKSSFGIEVNLTPKPEWKLLAANSSSVKPLRLKFAPSKCLKLKGSMHSSTPDLSGTDDSGAYSEYFTKTASLRQELSRVACTQKKGVEETATLTYLLCQNNKCVGPFSREIRFKAP